MPKVVYKAWEEWINPLTSGDQVGKGLPQRFGSCVGDAMITWVKCAQILFVLLEQCILRYALPLYRPSGPQLTLKLGLTIQGLFSVPWVHVFSTASEKNLLPTTHDSGAPAGRPTYWSGFHSLGQFFKTHLGSVVAKNGLVSRS